MSAQRFSAGKRFQWLRDDKADTEAFEITGAPCQGILQLENLLTGDQLKTSLSELIKALFDGCLQFEVHGKVARPHTRESAITTQPQHTDLSDVPSHLLIIAQRRLEILTPLLQLSPSARTRQRISEHAERVKQLSHQRGDGSGLNDAVSITSIYRWMHDYTQAGNDLRALIPNTAQRGGKDQTRISSEVESLLDIVIKDVLLHREIATHNDVRAELAVRIHTTNQTLSRTEHLRMPSLATIQRRVASLDLQARLKATKGTRVAKRAFKQHGQNATPCLPLERVEIDHTRLDIIVVDDRDGLPLGRPTLTHCLDYATRYPLGYYIGFEPPSWYAVMECLHHAICPKADTQGRFGTQHGWSACGIPVMLRIDNGKEFIGHDLKDACVLLGIVLEQAPVLSPEFKPGVERMFGTLNTGFVHGLPGTTFSSPSQRGDYDASKHACVTLNDFERIFNVFITDIYAQRFHRGLNGIPARRWEQAMQAGFSPRVPPSREELLVLLGRAETRIIQHYGIELEGLRYNCSELAPLRHRLDGLPAKVKYHPGDLSRIHVYDPTNKHYLVVPALDSEYAQGLSLWKHQVIKAYAREEMGRVDLVALGEARRQIKQIIADARQNKRTAKRASTQSQPQRIGRQMARYETGDHPPSQRAKSTGAATDAQQDHASLSDTPCVFKPVQSNTAEASWEIVLGTTRTLKPEVSQ